jgi:hypothetical protein
MITDLPDVLIFVDYIPLVSKKYDHKRFSKINLWWWTPTILDTELCVAVNLSTVKVSGRTFHCLCSLLNSTFEIWPSCVMIKRHPVWNTTRYVLGIVRTATTNTTHVSSICVLGWAFSSMTKRDSFLQCRRAI